MSLGQHVYELGYHLLFLYKSVYVSCHLVYWTRHIVTSQGPHPLQLDCTSNMFCIHDNVLTYYRTLQQLYEKNVHTYVRLQLFFTQHKCVFVCQRLSVSQCQHVKTFPVYTQPFSTCTHMHAHRSKGVVVRLWSEDKVSKSLYTFQPQINHSHSVTILATQQQMVCIHLSNLTQPWMVPYVRTCTYSILNKLRVAPMFASAHVRTKFQGLFTIVASCASQTSKYEHLWPLICSTWETVVPANNQFAMTYECKHHSVGAISACVQPPHL